MSNIVTLYENDDFLVVDKPSGLVVHATLDKDRENLYDLLKEKYSDLSLIHRLDKDTSGAILFSKKKSANNEIQKIFDERLIKKSYIAIVHGEWKDPEGKLEDFIKKEKIKGLELMVKVSKGGQKAITYFEVVEIKNNFSLIKFTLETGRMHQIRVQSALRNHPLLGDGLYGKKDRAERLYLHSHILEFVYKNQLIKVESRIPDAFKQYF